MNEEQPMKIYDQVWFWLAFIAIGIFAMYAIQQVTG